MQTELLRLPSEADRVLISTNPTAGARSGEANAAALAERLSEEGFSVEVFTDLEQLASTAAAAHRQGTLRTVVAAGGDGTAAAVVNLTKPGVPITLLPLGTENLLSKFVGASAELEPLCETIREGLTVRMDAGRVDGRIFLLMVGCGFDAEVIRRLHNARRGNISHFAYAKPILDSIRNYQYPQLRVYCDLDADTTTDQAATDQTATDRTGARQSEAETATASGGSARQIEARWVFIVNIPRYAMGLNMMPQAVATDGLLDVCTFKEGSFWHGLRYLSGVVMGQHQSWDDCVTARACRVRVEADEEVPYQLDGDPGGVLPLEAEILPGRLTLIVPPRFASQQGHQVARRTG